MVMEICHEMLMTSKFHCFENMTNLANVSDTSGQEKLSSDVQAYLLNKGSCWVFQETPHAFFFHCTKQPPCDTKRPQRRLGLGICQQTNKNKYPLHTVKSNKQCIYSTELLYTWEKVKRILPPGMSISGHILPVL